MDRSSPGVKGPGSADAEDTSCPRHYSCPGINDSNDSGIGGVYVGDRHYYRRDRGGCCFASKETNRQAHGFGEGTAAE